MSPQLMVVDSAELSGRVKAFQTEPTWDVAKIMQCKLERKSNLSSY